jgi:protein O-GlcNAc transferase
VRLEPRLAEAHLNLANALYEARRYEEAIASFRETIALRPDLIPARNGLGNSYRALSRLEAALGCYREALRIAPEDAEVHCNLGVALADLGKSDEAIASYRKAVSLDPSYANAHYNLGISLQEQKRHGEAIACFERALAIDPRHGEALGALVMSELGDCRWDSIAAHAAGLARQVREGRGIVEPFTFLLVSGDPAEQKLCAERYAAKTVPARAAPPATPARGPRTRLAYLSGDFRNHAVAQLTAGLFELHDRSRFEVTGVSLGPDDGSEMRARLERGFERFIDVRSRSDAEVAAMLRDLGVDIAIDMSGYMNLARPGILALRPAPVQVNFLGYPGTLGAGFLDYIVADPFLIPVERAGCYSEQVVYLPDTYLVNDAKRAIADETPSRTELGLPEDAFVFCCFNLTAKITQEMFSVWMRLLQQIPRSMLWLLEDTAGARRNLEREARSRGVDAGRLVFAPRMKTEQHLARQRRADLFLDTLPYNAHTTASDALWAGLPLLSCPGRTFAGRVAGSLLRAVGLPELVARDVEDYEARALELARNPPELAQLRSKLARNRLSAPLFDTDRFRRHIEAAYATMHEIRLRGGAPRSFAVEPVSPS